MVKNRLKELRVECGIAQEQLARYLDVEQTVITELEKGRMSFCITQIEKLCNLFDCTEEYLLEIDDRCISLLV